VGFVLTGKICIFPPVINVTIVPTWRELQLKVQIHVNFVLYILLPKMCLEKSSRNLFCLGSSSHVDDIPIAICCLSLSVRCQHQQQQLVCMCVCVCVMQMERLRSFDFDVWRMQYLQWLKSKRSRIVDFFHRQDTDGDGRITRKEFIDGIIRSRMSAFLFASRFMSVLVTACCGTFQLVL